ncbi:MAG TPA: formate dehydrogenase subunit delta [Streptosporangiaceae bacterium]|nr:formate dehydrogenase subunit delta [Streptosporangiaceae bacterium]
MSDPGLPPPVRLANDIAVQFAHLPFAEGIERVATHMRQFWEPRMRKALLAYLDAGGPDLDPLAAAAAERLRQPAA